MNLLEKSIEFLSPEWAAKRAAARISLKRLEGGGYDNVPTWRNSGNWHAVDALTGEGANELRRDEARRKARHLERNSEIVNAIIQALTRNVVGKGFNLQVRSKDKQWNNEVEALWREWIRPGNCEVTGKFNLNEMLAMVVRRQFVDGGILLVKTYDPKLPVPLQLQMIEVDCLYDIADKDNVVGGIEINTLNKPINYYIQEIPLNNTQEIGKYNIIPAERVYFLAYHQRPSEVREMTPLARTLMEIRDLDELQDAVVFKEKINAAVAVWITNNKEGQGVYGAAVAAGADKGGGKLPKRIQPGSVNELGVGQDVRTLIPSGQASEYADFNMAALRRISAGHGLSYEIVTRDVSQVTYSSARQNLLEDWKAVEMAQDYLISHLLDFVFEEVVKSAILKGTLRRPADFYEPGTEKDYLKHEFIGQGMPWIDPNKEAQANTTLLNSYLTTLKTYYAKQGKDWEEEIEQAKLEHKTLQEAGLIISKEENQNAEESEETDGKQPIKKGTGRKPSAKKG